MVSEIFHVAVRWENFVTQTLHLGSSPNIISEQQLPVSPAIVRNTLLY